ncbi:MAG: hypothetical protein ACREJ2_14840 [Planctomycetota bacterium]
MATLMPGVENIGRRERFKRLTMAVVMFLVAAGLAIGLVVSHADRWWRLTVALPALLSGLGFFQYQARTCVMHAMQGTCNLDQGTKSVEDASLRGLLLRRARSVTALAVAFAVLVTAAVMFLPG